MFVNMIAPDFYILIINTNLKSDFTFDFMINFVHFCIRISGELLYTCNVFMAYFDFDRFAKSDALLHCLFSALSQMDISCVVNLSSQSIKPSQTFTFELICRIVPGHLTSLYFWAQESYNGIVSSLVCAFTNSCKTEDILVQTCPHRVKYNYIFIPRRCYFLHITLQKLAHGKSTNEPLWYFAFSFHLLPSNPCCEFFVLWRWTQFLWHSDKLGLGRLVGHTGCTPTSRVAWLLEVVW